jgi:hypothetical protein
MKYIILTIVLFLTPISSFAEDDNNVRFIDHSKKVINEIIISWVLAEKENMLRGLLLKSETSFGQLSQLQFLPVQGGWLSIEGGVIANNSYHTYEFRIPATLLNGAKFRAIYTTKEGKFNFVTIKSPKNL